MYEIDCFAWVGMLWMKLQAVALGMLLRGYLVEPTVFTGQKRFVHVFIQSVKDRQVSSLHC